MELKHILDNCRFFKKTTTCPHADEQVVVLIMMQCINRYVWF